MGKKGKMEVKARPAGEENERKNMHTKEKLRLIIIFNQDFVLFKFLFIFIFMYFRFYLTL